MKQFEEQPKSFRKDPRSFRPQKVKRFDDFNNESKMSDTAKSNELEDTIVVNISNYMELSDWDGTEYTKNEIIDMIENEGAIEDIQQALETEWNIKIEKFEFDTYEHDDNKASFYVKAIGDPIKLSDFFSNHEK